MWFSTTGDAKIEGDSNQIEVCKMLNGHANIDHNIFVKIKTGEITGWHDITLVKGQGRLYFRKYSFSQRTVNEWNKGNFFNMATIQENVTPLHSTALAMNAVQM